MEDRVIEPEVITELEEINQINKNAIATIHNNLIQARHKLSLEEIRLMDTIISFIQPEDEDFKIYKIPVSIFKDMYGEQRKDIYDVVKRTIEGLLSKPIKIETVNKNGKKSFKMFNFISYGEYLEGQGSFYISISPQFKPYLLKLKEFFTKIPIKYTYILKSKYAIRLYELLKQYEETGFRIDGIKDLREMLGVEDCEYSRFVDFERWVLKTAVKEINEKTDIEVSYKKKKTGRKITHIEFTIKSKKAEIEDTTQTTKSIPQSVDIQEQKKVVSKDSENSDKEIFLKNKSAVKYMDAYWKEVIVPAHKKGELNKVHLRLLKAPFKAAVYDEEKNVIYIPAPDAVYKSFLNNEIDSLKQFFKEKFNISDVVVKEINLDDEEDTTQITKRPSKSVDTQGQKQGIKNVIDNFPPDDLYRNVLNLLELNYKANPEEIDILRYYTYAIYKTDVKPKEMIITTDIGIEKGKAEIRKILKKYFEKIKEIVRIDTYNNYTAKIDKKLLEKGQDLPNWMEKGAK